MAAFRALAAARKLVNRHDSSQIFRASGFLRHISLTVNRRGLEEFFPPGALESEKPILEDKEFKTGRRWHASDLRLKSNSDLHKLWYVLLKEMNMLQTVKEEAKRLQIPMPSPERIKKVQKSMAMIKVVIGERERALRNLETIGYKSIVEEVIASDQKPDKIKESEVDIKTAKVSNIKNDEGNTALPESSKGSNLEHPKLSMT